ncbi:MAG: glycoside hydrolase family 127 protein [Firmicutes bacterium]|nr:glycoside hydrolase family 127 protein [Bacillota bacterium]
MPASIAGNRKPLPQGVLAPLPLTAIRPRGWLYERIANVDGATLEDRLMKACLLRENSLLGAAGDEVAWLLTHDGDLTEEEIRALMRYHGVSGDKRAPLRLFQHAKALLGALTGGARWGAARAANASGLLHMALWLYNLTGRKALLELCRLIKAQAPDWMSTFHVFSQTRPVLAPPPMDADAYYRVHGPTVAASLKTPALQALFEGGLKNETAFRAGWEKLTRYHGAAHGLFNADPLLGGANPSAQVDPETVAELIRSLEVLLWALGDPSIGDLLERIAYGALPAARGRQAANQLMPAPPGHPVGMAQAAASLWMATQDEGLAVIGYAPCEVRWRVAGQPIQAVVETGYPFDETITIHVRMKAPARFPLYLRVPAFSRGAFAKVGDEEPIACGQGFEVIERVWQNGDKIELTLPMRVQTVRRYHQTISVERGPLTYVLPVTAQTRWNLALLPAHGFEVTRQGEVPMITAYGAPVPGWRKSGERPAPPPVAPEVSGMLPVRLMPYGMTDARIAQFPVGNSTFTG